MFFEDLNLDDAGVGGVSIFAHRSVFFFNCVSPMEQPKYDRDLKYGTHNLLDHI